MTTTLARPDRAVPPGAPVPVRRSALEVGAHTGLLVLAAATYLVNLSVSGWANAFYSGAVRAMTQNWTAFFFGSADAGNTVTVDKPPASLWVEAASAKVFGLSSWSILVPEALMGVATTALLYAAVRRVSGPVAALVTGVVFALTPVVVLMFRFNNPDAALVLLMVGAAYAVVRAVEAARTRWLVLAGVLLGVAFLTKTAQSLVPLPTLALAYLWAAPTGLGRRIRQLLLAGGVMVVSAGWWFVLAAVWPGTVPYIGGSTNGSAWQLAIGYNGLGRLFGEGFGTAAGTAAGAGTDAGAGTGGGFGGGAGGPGGGFGADAGILRMFDTSVGGQVAWLLPAALLLLVAGLVATRRAARTDRVRASLVVWGGWTLVTGLTFSLMEGTFHQYYTVALAPGVAATVGVGAAELWRRREAVAARVCLAIAVAVTGAWAWVLLGRTADFVPWLRWVVLAAAVVAVLALFARGRRAAITAVTTAVLMASAGPAAYASQTVQTAYTSGIPIAGPASAARSGGPGGGGFPGAGGAGATTGRGGGAGGEGDVSQDVVALLQGAGTPWSAATGSTSTSAGLALASGTDVMGIGGFTGSDPAPTLAQFQADVTAGKIHYFIPGRSFGGGGGGGAGASPGQLPSGLSAAQEERIEEMIAAGGGQGGAGGPGGRGTSSSITSWVEATFTSTTVGGTTVYDLTSPKA